MAVVKNYSRVTFLDDSCLLNFGFSNVPYLVLLALVDGGAHDRGQHYIDQHGDKECPSQNIYGSAPPKGLNHDLI